MVYPLIPSAPVVNQSNSANVVFDLAGDVRDIYGLEIRVPPATGSGGVPLPLNYVLPSNPLDNLDLLQRYYTPGLVSSSASNYNAIGRYSPSGNFIPFPYPTQFNTGDIVLFNCGQDGSFDGLRVINYASPSGASGVWNMGWADYNRPFPSTVGGPPGNNIATAQLYRRGPFINLTSASGSLVTGVFTITTNGNHPYSVNDGVIIGTLFTSMPAGGRNNYGDGAFINGQYRITSVPSSNTFNILLSQSLCAFLATAGYIGGNYGLAGYSAQLPAAGINLATGGVLVQKPVFAPADLNIDLTTADIQAILIEVLAVSPISRLAGLNAYFFNLTWDYSQPVNVSSFIVPSISGLAVNEYTQRVEWSLGTGRPLGYRMLLQDPVSGITYAKATVDNPSNPQTLLQYQMSTSDFYSDRVITVTPYDALGDGIPGVTTHAASGGLLWANGTTSIPGLLTASGINSGNTASYTIGCTFNGQPAASQVFVRIPLDRAIRFESNFTPSRAIIETAPTATYVLYISRNGINVGTITFAAGQAGIPAALFSGGPLVFNFGDTIRVIGQSSTDLTAANIGFTLAATKVFINPVTGIFGQ